MLKACAEALAGVRTMTGTESMTIASETGVVSMGSTGCKDVDGIIIV